MSSNFTFLVFALTLLASILGLSRYIAYSRRRKLWDQADDAAIHGEAAHSLQTEKMRIRKANRDKGVVGELGVAKDLEYLAREYGLTVLHDLSIPGTTANIDHILISKKVVYVIDAKNYTGIVNIGPNRAGKKTLRVGGRDQSILVSKAKNYGVLVREFLESEGVKIKVLPLLAFYQAKFHQDSATSIDGVAVNIFGIENELMRYANIKGPENDPKVVATALLSEFPLKK